MATTNLKIGKRVTFETAGRARGPERKGKIETIETRANGIWYGVKDAETGRVYQVRPSLVRAA